MNTFSQAIQYETMENSERVYTFILGLKWLTKQVNMVKISSEGYNQWGNAKLPFLPWWNNQLSPGKSTFLPQFPQHCSCHTWRKEDQQPFDERWHPAQSGKEQKWQISWENSGEKVAKQWTHQTSDLYK